MTAPKVTPTTYRVGDLNAEQRRRAASLAAARIILGSDANVLLVIKVARWINNGVMPQ